MADAATADPVGMPEATRLYLSVLFVPKDPILVRLIESWTENGRKHNRVVYKTKTGRRIVTHMRASALLNCGLKAWQSLLNRSHEENANVFIGVCPRFYPSDYFDLAWQIRTVRVLWADIDHCTPDEALKRCEAAGLPRPTMIVNSGNGVHLYWLLAEPYLIADVGDPPPVYKEWIDQGEGKKKKAIQFVYGADNKTKLYQDEFPELSAAALKIQDVVAGIAAKIGGDHTKDLSRLLRLPGTMNRKDGRNGAVAVPCELVECDPDRRYPLAEFERFFASRLGTGQRSAQPAGDEQPVQQSSTPRQSRSPAGTRDAGGKLTTTRRVSRGSPCPICGRPDWCLVAQDERYVVCMRTSSDRPALGGQGGWIHRLREGGTGTPSPPDQADMRSARQPAIAPLERRDRVYRRLLCMLTLADADYRLRLEPRGYTHEEARRRGYRTLPLTGRARLCRELVQGEHVEGLLRGVPGFWFGAGGGERYAMLGGSPGILIPCRSPSGLVRALRIMPQDRTADRKYTWLSSANKPGGVSSGTHCHVARPHADVRDDAVWITEGELKADLAAEALGAVVVSIPGVSLWQLAVADLLELHPRGGRVVVALDSDLHTKPAVHRAAYSLLTTAHAIGYTTEIALWDASLKGIDDLLVSGRRPDLHPPTAIQPPAWDLRLSSRVLAEIIARPQPGMLTVQGARQALAEALGGDEFQSQCA